MFLFCFVLSLICFIFFYFFAIVWYVLFDLRFLITPLVSSHFSLKQSLWDHFWITINPEFDLIHTKNQLNTLPTMSHGKMFCIIVWEPHPKPHREGTIGLNVQYNICHEASLWLELIKLRPRYNKILQRHTKTG